MVVNTRENRPPPGVSAVTGQGSDQSAPGPPAEVVWHDLECGSYRADLPLWRDLAERHGDPILDVGAGTGRVSLDLAQAGHRVTALDLEDVYKRQASDCARRHRGTWLRANWRSWVHRHERPAIQRRVTYARERCS